MKRIVFALLFIISALLFHSCDRELISSGFPNVITLSAEDHGETIVFSGELKNDEDIKIDEVGFIWQNNDDPFSKPGFKVKSEIPGSGNFTAEIAWSVTNDKNYVLRTYAKCGDKMVYGEPLVFKTGLILPCQLFRIEPDSAFMGDTIKLIGRGFNLTLQYNMVLIDGKNSSLIGVNDSVLTCIVPAELTKKGFNVVAIVVNGINGDFGSKFKLLLPPPPEISSLSSTSIKYGNILTVYGQNMNSVTGVLLGSASQSITVFPKNTSSGSMEIEVYNQQNPSQLLPYSSFKVGLVYAGETIWSDQVTIQSSWARLADFPSNPRYKAGCFSLGGMIYIGGGAEFSNVFKDFWKYDPISGNWTRMADLPGVARIYPASISGTDYGYMGCGLSADNSSKYQLYDFFKYDPVSNLWTAISNYPDNISNFFIGFTATVNGRLFVSLSNTVQTMREIVSDTWISRTAVAELMDNTGTSVFFIGNCFYVICGFNIDGSSSREVWEYNIVTGTWIRKSDFPGQTRHVAINFSIGSYGYYGCGRGWLPETQYKDMWRYEPVADKWIRIEDFPGGYRSHTISASANNLGYAGFGILGSSSYFKDFWKYNPE